MCTCAQEQESGRPYDIKVTDASGVVTYIEVKSTRARVRGAFPVSREELSFAAKMGSAYCVYRVTNAGG